MRRLKAYQSKLAKLAITAFLPACLLIPGAQAADTVIVQWNDQALQAIRDTHPGPPIVARSLAITHTCMFDAWAAYSNAAVGTRLGGSLRVPGIDRTDANKAKATSYAAFRCLKDLFPQPVEVANFTALMTALGYDPNDVSMANTTPSGIGNIAGQAVLDFRHTDGSNQLGDLNAGPYSDYTGYTSVNTPFVVNDASRWQPLQVSNGAGGFVTQKFIAPFWQKVTPFALTSATQFRPLVGPAKFGTSDYVLQTQQVLDYSANLNDTSKMIAEYWADGPKSELPPGHWTLFASFVSRRDHHSLDEDARMFFAMTNAILDASISSWDAKRAFDSVRPITAVQTLFKGKMVKCWAGPGLGAQMIPGENWRPYQPTTVVTPPFPEYFSGHSVFSAAGAEVLKLFTKSDKFGGSVTFLKGKSRVEPGFSPSTDVTLSWKTFSDAADQAGLSRRYGGIHFIQGDLDGRSRGTLIGRQAWKKAKTFFNPDDNDDNGDDESENEQ